MKKIVATGGNLDFWEVPYLVRLMNLGLKNQIEIHNTTWIQSQTLWHNMSFYVLLCHLQYNTIRFNHYRAITIISITFCLCKSKNKWIITSIISFLFYQMGSNVAYHREILWYRPRIQMIASVARKTHRCELQIIFTIISLLITQKRVKKNTFQSSFEII